MEQGGVPLICMKHLNHHQFISVARGIPEDRAVPPAFEKRIMARIRRGTGHPAETDLWAPWARLLWQAAAACLAVSFAAGVAAALAHENQPVDFLATELERAVLAPIALDQEGW